MPFQAISRMRSTVLSMPHSSMSQIVIIWMPVRSTYSRSLRGLSGPLIPTSARLVGSMFGSSAVRLTGQAWLSFSPATSSAVSMCESIWM